MWYDEAVFYQIYPLGFCGAFDENVENKNIGELSLWIPHLKELNVSAIYFSPIFESDYHGYDTKDYRKIDKRLGTNEDFKELVKKLQGYITENYYHCTDEILSGLGQMYVADQRFKDNIDKHGEGTAEFTADAIAVYCQEKTHD